MTIAERLRQLDRRVLRGAQAPSTAAQRGKRWLLVGCAFMAFGIATALIIGPWTIFWMGAGYVILGAVLLWPSRKDTGSEG